MKLEWRGDCGYDGSTLVANIHCRAHWYDIRVSSHQLTEDEYIIKWKKLDRHLTINHLRNMCEIIYGIAKDHSNQEAALAAINVYCKLRGPQWYIP